MHGCLLKRNILARIVGISGLPILLLGGASSEAMSSGTALANHGFGPRSAKVADVDITGRVTGEDGSGLPGASILLKATTRGTITDSDGNFKLSISDGENAVLVVSLVGYISQEITVGSQKVINIPLKVDNKVLEEVVVVGYGTQRQEAVTGSVVSVTGDIMREVPSANLSQALQGRVVGVEISQTSTKPGAAMQILIRGQRSLRADNNPLIVLDGIPFAGSLTDINPNNIKSLDILKDASATAIYGSRGANGVILITTNTGKRGQKALFSYNGFHGTKSVFAKYPMMNGPEFAALRAASLQKYQNTIDESNDVNTDWQDMIYRTGMMTSHDLSVSAGTDKGSYSFGLGYYKENAVVPLQDFTRFSLQGSVDQEINKYVRLGLSTNSNFTINNGNNIPAVGMALARTPIANPYNADGTMKTLIQEQTSGPQWVPSLERFNSLGDRYVDRSKAYGSYNTLFGEVKIPGVTGLKYRANLGLNFRQTNGGNYTGQGVFSGNPLNVSSAGINNSLTTNWAIENLVSYDRSFKKHEINAVALYSAQQNTTNNSSVGARDIPADAFQFYNLGRADGIITVDPANQGYNQWGLLSYMGRVMYSYDDRYMLSVTYRADGSSRLASGHQWNAYPAISAGWNLHKENFMSGLSQVNLLKLRAGYGQTSNQAVNPYETLGLLATRPYNFGDDTYSTGFYVSNAPNPRLGWEFSNTLNLGLDFKLFGNRLSGTVEYYEQKTKNVLLGVGLPPTSGVGGYTANIGQTQNKGVELNLNGTILENVNGWTWDVGFNVYTNRNKLVSLSSGQQRDEGNWWFVGHPINVIYDYEKIGIWQPEDRYRDILEPGGNVGMIRVKYTGEYNADGAPTRAINASDRQILSMQPDFQGGFNTHVSYKGFDLGIVGAFKSGGLLNSTLYGSSGYLNNLNSRSGNNVKVDYWTPENTSANYPAPGGIGGDNPKYGSTLGYFDASYLKIRTMTLGYNVDSRLLGKVGITRLRVYFTAQNPFVMFSPYHRESGMDPETNSFGNENAAVPLSGALRRILTIGTNTPATRNYLVGVNLTF
jgi:TonB-linked SusC/RagA family outer membrane protein